MNILMVLIILLCISSTLVLAEGDQDVEHVILYNYDAFRPDYLAMYDLPNFESLVNEGVFYAEAIDVFPSTTTVNQTSLVTGAYPDRTGIPNVKRYDRKQDRIIAPLRDVQVPTISEILNKSGKKTVSLAHFMLEHRQETAYFARGVGQFKDAFDRYSPELLVYYDARTDSYGHKYGPYSKKMKEILGIVDQELGEMLAYLEEKGLREKTAIIITSDHGMTENTQPGVMGTRLIDNIETLGFKIAFNNEEIEDDTDIVIVQTGCSFLYFREGRINEKEYELLMKKLNDIPNMDVYDANQLRDLNQDPELVGDIALVPHKGYSIMPGSGGGIHGRLEEQQMTLILSGAGIKKGIVKSKAEIIDVTPTILDLLNVEIPDSVQGKVLKGALEEKAINWNSYF